MKIYISGPMTGYEDLNFPAFNKAAKYWRDKGHEVVNPAEINSDPNADWTDCIIDDIKAMKDCDTLYLLKGWPMSAGALIERIVAQKRAMAVIYEGSE